MSKRSYEILALVTDAFGAYGGISQYNQDLLTELSHLEMVDNVAVLPRIWNGAKATKTPNIRMFSASMNKFLYALRAVWIAFRLKPDLIYCGHLYHGPLAARLAKLFKAKLVSQLHGTEVWEPLTSSLLEPLKRSDRVLCVSEDTKKRYRAQLTHDPNNAVVLHNTVGTQFSPDGREQSREKFNVVNDYVLLSVSRLDARKGGYKGHERVINTLPDLLQKRPNAIYLIAGTGDDRDRLVNLVEQRGLSEKVRFLGKVPADDLIDLYRAADLFVLPSMGEGFGIVYLEAMASGTLALGLNIGGAPDALCDGELGVCVDESAFASALVRAATADGVDRETLSRKTISRFGPIAFGRSVRSVFGEVFARNCRK